jgi:hypothetical protein
MAALRAGIEFALPTTMSGQMSVKMSGKTAEAILLVLRTQPTLIKSFKPYGLNWSRKALSVTKSTEQSS